MKPGEAPVPARPISHVEHRVPGTEVWRPGGTSHEESGTDLGNYLRPLEQVHAGALHGSGVVEGLAVSTHPGSSSVVVAPGVAVDPSGRHVVLAPGGHAETADDPDATSRVVPVPDAGVELPLTGSATTVLVTVQWRETFVDQPGPGAAAFVTRHTPWLRIVAADAEPAADRVVLATLALDAGGVVVADGLRDTGRAVLALTTGALTLGTTTVRRSTDGTATLGEGPAARLAGRPDGGLDVRLPGDPGRPALTVTGTDGVGDVQNHDARVEVGGRLHVGSGARVDSGLGVGPFALPEARGRLMVTGDSAEIGDRKSVV